MDREQIIIQKGKDWVLLFMSEEKVKIRVLSVIDFRQAVEQDHSYALFQLGMMFFNGKNVIKNYTKAVKWLLKAAEQGSTEAMYQLGRMYQYGDGVSQDDDEAVKWFRRAGKKDEDITRIMNEIK